MPNNAHKARFHMEARKRTTNIVAYQQGEAVGFWKHLNDTEFDAVVSRCLAETDVLERTFGLGDDHAIRRDISPRLSLPGV